MVHPPYKDRALTGDDLRGGPEGGEEDAVINSVHGRGRALDQAVASEWIPS